jgi:hypothetical protein
MSEDFLKDDPTTRKAVLAALRQLAVTFAPSKPADLRALCRSYYFQQLGAVCSDPEERTVNRRALQAIDYDKPGILALAADVLAERKACH